jgi:hypothetical protein
VTLAHYDTHGDGTLTEKVCTFFFFYFISAEERSKTTVLTEFSHYSRFPSSHDQSLEHYISNEISNSPSPAMAKLEKAFLKFYLCIASRKFFFLLDINRTGEWTCHIKFAAIFAMMTGRFNPADDVNPAPCRR